MRIVTRLTSLSESPVKSIKTLRSPEIISLTSGSQSSSMPILLHSPVELNIQSKPRLTGDLLGSSRFMDGVCCRKAHRDLPKSEREPPPLSLCLLCCDVPSHSNPTAFMQIEESLGVQIANDKDILIRIWFGNWLYCNVCFQTKGSSL